MGEDRRDAQILNVSVTFEFPIREIVRVYTPKCFSPY